MSFEKRLQQADRHELNVVTTINQYRNWKAFRFGQALLDVLARDLLKKTKSPIRWIPDILALSPPQILLIDAKAGRTDTPNWTLEKSSHDAHKLIAQSLNVRVIYVWPDLSCNDALTLHPTVSGTETSFGSGTPYWLIRKEPVNNENEWPMPISAIFLE